MNNIITIVAIGLALAVALPTAPATALNDRSFVSPQGDDSNDCTLGSPCRFFQAALAKTNPGGEIAVLGTASVHPIGGRELRALRRLKREALPASMCSSVSAWHP
jgi:hypothetical protein